MKFSTSLSALALPLLATLIDAHAHGPIDAAARLHRARNERHARMAAALARGDEAGAEGLLVRRQGPAVVPLDQITSGMPVPSPSLASTPAPGATPPIPGAPPLPAATVVATNYPPPNQPPPVDSPEVREWLTELQGHTIPGYTPNPDISCANQTAAAADTSRCWWTCGQCKRDSDVDICNTKLDWGLTFDDGPDPLTVTLLEYLDSIDTKATFYLLGTRVVMYPEIVRAQHLAGHELAGHTWSHFALTTLTTEQIVAELGWTRKAIKDVTGVTIKYWRPPFGDIDDRVRAISTAMGMTPVLWTSVGEVQFDTEDFRVAAGEYTGAQSMEAWRTEVIPLAAALDTGFIVLQHDIRPPGVDLAIGYVLPEARAHDPPFNLMSVNMCMDEPLGNSYVETSGHDEPPILSNGQPNPSGTGAAAAAPTGGSGSSTRSGSASQTPGAGQGNGASAVSAGWWGAAALGAAAWVVGL